MQLGKARFVGLLLWLSAIGSATTWSGFLVDSSCWRSRETNVSGDSISVNRDFNRDVRFCAPTDDTKRFAVVTKDWRRLKFDPNGNVKALKLVQNQKRPVYAVTVGGALKRRTIQVSCLSAVLIKSPR